MDTSEYTDRKAAKRITKHPAYQRCRNRANTASATLIEVKKERTKSKEETTKRCAALAKLIEPGTLITEVMAASLHAALREIAARS